MYLSLAHYASFSFILLIRATSLECHMPVTLAIGSTRVITTTTTALFGPFGIILLCINFGAV
jgi:hypothetical protein